MEVPGLVRVASYQRAVRASLERVWENVLDWEHLPWLHRSTFCRIERLTSGDWGWRARVGLEPAASAREIELELVIERGELRYVSRTLAGPGCGSEIWTELVPMRGEKTGVRVGFYLPNVAPEHADAIGRTYTDLYRRLWDEDEGMMRQRAAALARRAAAPEEAPAPVRLGSLAEVRATLPLRVETGGRLWRVLEIDGALAIRAAECPHRLGPLGAAPAIGGCVTCPWHGYRFDLRSGASADGRGLRLPAPPRLAVEGGDVWMLPACAGRESCTRS
jgi:nitrite reductase/ring-hydroxylating ferredoxin subunit